MHGSMYVKFVNAKQAREIYCMECSKYRRFQYVCSHVYFYCYPEE